MTEWVCQNCKTFTPKAKGTTAMNLLMEALYREGFWIHRDRGLQLAELFMLFLKCFQCAVSESRARGLNRFSLVPKIHMLHHISLRMKSECQQAAFCCNPLAESVQIQEDYIGRPSRLSRRVGMKLLHLRVVQRSLISTMYALKRADSDNRF